MFVRATGLLAVLALAGLTACATTTRVNLSNAAQNLEYDANALVEDSAGVRDSGEAAAPTDARSEGPTDYPRYGYSHEYTRDARALARNAHELRVAVDERASDSEVRAVFDRVSRSYHAVRDEVAHSDSLQAQRDFAPLTDSYRSVEHELGIYESRRDYVPPA
jgi:hypothetical protein